MRTRTPIVLIIFRRPDLTEKVFEVIRRARPPKLFIYADGPSPDRPGEAEKCAASRAVVENIDWECEVVREYADCNMGPWKRIASGVTAAFMEVEELIVLEDDCFPDPTFFQYCDELLERYRDDERIMHIAGNHLHPESPRGIRHSYSFAWHNVAWGYATWRRAWQHFDLSVPAWEELRDTDFLRRMVGHPVAVERYGKIFDQLLANPGEFDGYDYAWTFACWSQRGLSILPDRTLVQNIGFGPDSTHFEMTPDDPRGSLRSEPMSFPLRHPDHVVRDAELDDYLINTYVVSRSAPSGWRPRILRKLKRMIVAFLPTPIRRSGARALSRVRAKVRPGAPVGS